MKHGDDPGGKIYGGSLAEVDKGVGRRLGNIAILILEHCEQPFDGTAVAKTGYSHGCILPDMAALIGEQPV